MAKNDDKKAGAKKPEAPKAAPKSTPKGAASAKPQATAKAAKAEAPRAAKAEPVKAEATSTPATGEVKTHSFRRKLIGRVVSNKMQKTVVVEVSRYSLDRVYKKYVKHRVKYKAHDEQNEFKVGDRVEIQEFRPISREKRFKVVRLVSRPVIAE